MAVSTNYEYLSDLSHFNTGYIIIEDKLFQVDDGTVQDSWELQSKTLRGKVKEAREVAELSVRTRIVYDDDDVYSADVVSDEGTLVTYTESYFRDSEEDQDDYDSLCEYYLIH